MHLARVLRLIPLHRSIPHYIPTNLCLEVLTVHSNDLRLFGAKALTNNVVHLPQQQKVQMLTSLAMTWFGPSIEPNTFPTPRGCATCYVPDVGVAAKTKVCLTVKTNRNHFFSCDIYTNTGKTNRHAHTHTLPTKTRTQVQIKNSKRLQLITQ